MAGIAAVPVLLTRPAAQAARFADQLTNRFGTRVVPILSPLMRPVFHSPALPASCAAVVFTSETAVEAAGYLRAAGQVLPQLAICVGAQTARAATLLGFTARFAQGDATSLAALIRSDPPRGLLLYLHGRETRGNIAEVLNSAGIVTYSALVYQQEAQPLSAAAIQALGEARPVLVPLFSPRSANLLAKALSLGCRSPLLIAALSPAVAHAAQVLHPAKMCVATAPNSDAILAAVELLLTLPSAS